MDMDDLYTFSLIYIGRLAGTKGFGIAKIKLQQYNRFADPCQFLFTANRVPW